MDAETQLSRLIDRFSPEVAADARRVLALLQASLPTATRLVYDNYNALVVGFGPTDKASQAILSVALYPEYVRLFFLRGIDLPDPAGILEGDGSQVRSVKLKPISRIETAEVAALIDSAVAAAAPLPAQGKGSFVIKSISAKQRPRRRK
ncbi:MAG TPA: DUF1801 domain-containing protein [Sphingomicrobium sp.]|jgi:hypothetical protein|nr:DUF1801 domain-containing protein [Sphingomicrobium sp.]